MEITGPRHKASATVKKNSPYLHVK